MLYLTIESEKRVCEKEECVIRIISKHAMRRATERKIRCHSEMYRAIRHTGYYDTAQCKFIHNIIQQVKLRATL